MNEADIIIRGGKVLDPCLQEETVRDLAIQNGKIIKAEGVTAKEEIDASGCLVVPGLIDFHCHMGAGLSDLGIPGEAMGFPTGVTTAVDAGTYGTANYQGFRMKSLTSRLRVRAYLNVCPAGLITTAYHENLDPAVYQKQKLLNLLAEYPDQLLGLKVRQSRELVGDLGLAPLDVTRAIAEEAHCPLVVHTTNPPAPVEEIARRLRPGDVYAHVYQGRGETVIRDGHVIPEMKEHQKRGILFDAANGNNHFSFKVARTCLEEGFLPDIISTDLTAKSLYHPGKVFSLPFILSKYRALGMSWMDIFQRAITKPAEVLGCKKELGSLIPSTCADVAIFRPVPHKVLFQDTFGESLEGKELLRTELTMRAGTVVYRQIDF